MKAIIYAGFSLFSVATVYGLADYYTSKKRGVLENLYREEELPKENLVPAVNKASNPEKNITADFPVNNGISSATAKKSNKKLKRPSRTIRMAEFSRGRIIEPENPQLKPAELKMAVPVNPEEMKIQEERAIPETKIAEVVKPQRRISLNMYSRAPLKRIMNPSKTTPDTKPN